MPIRSRRPAFRRRGSSRRRMNWAESHGVMSFTANGQWGVQDLLSGYRATTGATTAGLTILRTHIWVLPHAPTAGDLFWVATSIVDTDEIVAPQTNALVPSPANVPYADWAFFQRYEFDVNLRLPVMNTDYAGVVLDLKSRRRCHDLQQTYALTIHQETVGTVAKAYDWSARTLIALP
jgi:hypothetical protein